ncbi:MAG: helix-turn-helix domain-containing protein [Candidatus Diapherotrites archaeon]|nr:helix-turn-helix domain-containing protein [Candidatus Diapherotrites archaeon]
MDEAILLQELVKLDFDEKEAKAYLALSKRSEATAADLSEMTHIERTLVYYVIQKLAKRGLVGVKIKNNVKYYSAAQPEKIRDELAEKTKTFDAIAPMLEKIRQQPFEGHAQADVFSGVEGFKTTVNDMFKSSKEFLVLGEEGHIQTNYPVLYKQYLKRLEAEDVREKVIVREDHRGKIWRSKNSEFRFISKELLSPATTVVYADKVLIITWENPMFLIMIKSPTISESFRAYFKAFWKMAKE